MPYLLTFHRSGNFRTRVEIPMEAAVIGRSHEAGVRIEDPSVSKQHASIEPIPGTLRFRIRDLGSKNGILFQGKRCQEVEVECGDEIRLGNVVVSICGEGPGTVAAPDPPERELPDREGEKRSPLPPGAERWLIGGGALLAGVLGLTLWLLPPSQKEAPPEAALVDASITAEEPLPAVKERSKPRELPLPAVPPGSTPESTFGSSTVSSTESSSSEPSREGPPPAIEFPLAEIAALPGERVAELQRIWLMLYGRWPSPQELVRSAPLQLEPLLLEARLKSEFWRERARCALRGRRHFPASGAFSLPAPLRPQEVAWLPGEWGTVLRAELKRAGTRSPHPYGEPAPLPERNGDDQAYRSWCLESLKRPATQLPPDAFLRSVWSLLWGEAPPDAVETELIQALASGIPWSELSPRILALLVYAPGVSLPAPSEPLDEWLEALLKVLLGREPDHHLVTELAGQLRADHLDYRVIIEECLLSRGWDPVGPLVSAPKEIATGGVVRVEVLCSFPVRELLRHPQQIPRLWKRFQI
ncbi:MAG: FHA domain-containing protein, partial [Planctomycetota bacterium]